MGDPMSINGGSSPRPPSRTSYVIVAPGTRTVDVAALVVVASVIVVAPFVLRVAVKRETPVEVRTHRLRHRMAVSLPCSP
jgi:hypothetical protein